MRKIISGMVFSATALTVSAAISITGVTAAQNPRTGQVDITYDLVGDDVIVTLDDILVDGVSIGPSNVTTVVGHVARKVSAGTGRTIVWNVRKDIPGRELTGTLTAKITAWPTDNPPDYMMVRLDDSVATTNRNNVFWYASAANLPDGGLTNPVYRLSRYVMRRIPAKNVVWRMGVSAFTTDAAGSTTQYAGAAPHYVKLTADYYIGVYPVTFGHHRAMVGSIPRPLASGASDETPISLCNHVTGSAYADFNYAVLRGSLNGWPVNGHTLGAGAVLATYRRLMGMEVDLPTDAQWEFAARAGSSKKFGVDGGTDSAGTSAAPNIWCTDTVSSSLPRPPGMLKPNKWGIYDMNGNIWEWCLDQYNATWTSEADNWYSNAYNQRTETYDGKTVYVDPVGMNLSTGADSDKNRVIRGGSVGNGSNNALSSFRNTQAGDRTTTNSGYGGVRLVCPVPAL